MVHKKGESELKGEVTLLLNQIGGGDAGASETLLELVYTELHRMAGRAFSRRTPGTTLQPTILVHDAFLKLVEHAGDWNDRQHFFAVAAKAMRQVLRDGARARGAEKRGGQWGRVTLAGLAKSQAPGEFDLVALDEGLTKLAQLNSRQARVVELRFLAGIPIEDVAKMLKISTTTVGDDWRLARAFLRREIRNAS